MISHLKTTSAIKDIIINPKINTKYIYIVLPAACPSRGKTYTNRITQYQIKFKITLTLKTKVFSPEDLINSLSSHNAFLSLKLLL